jgi:hypothetical protein
MWSNECVTYREGLRGPRAQQSTALPLVGLCFIDGGSRYREIPRFRSPVSNIVEDAHDVLGRRRYRTHTRYPDMIGYRRCARGRGDIRSHPTISRVALTITRVGTIPRTAHDIVGKRTILPRGPAISRAGDGRTYRAPAPAMRERYRTHTR